MWKPSKDEVLVSEKFASIVVALANISDKLYDLKTEIAEIRTEIGQIQTKQSFTTKPLLDKEDYD